MPKKVQQLEAQKATDMVDVEIIMAIYESVEMHKVVQMPVRTYCSLLELI